MKIFDYLNAITYNKKDIDFSDIEQGKDYDQFLINRWISMCEIYLPVVVRMNRYEVPKSVHYEFYRSALPKNKIYFNYIKKNVELNNEDTKIIAKHFEIGMKDAADYIKTMKKEDVEYILGLYKHEKQRG